VLSLSQSHLSDRPCRARGPLSELPTSLGRTVFCPLFFPYVINIGFTKSWGNKPQAAILVAAVFAGVGGQIYYGSAWSPLLGWLVVGWLTYVYAHLGVAFLLSGLASTPGCEMRLIPHL